MNHKRPPKTPKLLLVNHGKPANLADNLGPKNDFLRPNMQSQSPFCPGPFVSIHPHGHFETAFFLTIGSCFGIPDFSPKGGFSSPQAAKLSCSIHCPAERQSREVEFSAGHGV